MKDSGMTADIGGNAAGAQTGTKQYQITIQKINSLISFIGSVLFRLRKIVLAVPVVYWALKLASYNRAHLPEEVGINLLSTGEFAMTISRELAVMGPLVVTAACLVLMATSRKAMYPWAVSILTLILPFLLLLQSLPLRMQRRLLL